MIDTKRKINLIRIIAAVLCCLCALLACTGLGAAADSSYTVGRAESLVDGILAFQNADGEDDGAKIQNFVDGYAAENAGLGAEWYIIALAQYTDGTDFSAFKASLLRYISENTVYSASSRLKLALCLAAIGSTDAYINTTLASSVGEQGIMSLIFGLHLINNGYSCPTYTTDELIAAILELQCEDGGWNVMGSVGDADTTAMALQALAPHKDESNDVKRSIDQALELLESRQNEDGSVSSYGQANAESTAQLIIALTSLGIDPEDDERFIKNGTTLVDALMGFVLEDGSLCHTKGAGTNDIATVQGFCAAVALSRLSRGSLYLLDGARPEDASPAAPSAGIDDESGGTSEDGNDVNGEKVDTGTDYKLAACLIVIGCGLLAAGLLFAFKKRSAKNFIAVALVAALAIAGICLTDIQSADNYYGSPIDKPNAIGTVTLTIRCDTIVGRGENIPDNGVILDKVSIPICEGDTVYTVLTDAARAYGLHIDRKGGESSAYIRGIAYIYELEYGDLSGWIYTVGGEQPSVGAGSYVLKDGDNIEWHYTLSLGNDIK